MNKFCNKHLQKHSPCNYWYPWCNRTWLECLWNYRIDPGSFSRKYYRIFDGWRYRRKWRCVKWRRCWEQCGQRCRKWRGVGLIKHTVKTYRKLTVFWSFQGVKNGTLSWNGLSCSLLFMFKTKFILVRKWYILNTGTIL